VAWAYVSASANDATLGAANSQTIAPTANTVSGNRLICVINAWVNSATRPSVNSVSDAKNGTWNKDFETKYDDGGGGSITFTGVVSVWSIQLASALLTTDNVTVAFASSPGVGGGRLGILEYSGLSTAANPIDVSVTAAQTGANDTTTSVSTGNTAATGAANELMLFVFGDDGYNASWSAAPSVWTARINHMLDGTNADFWVPEKDSGASGTVESTTGTLSVASAFACGIGVYKLAAGGAAGPFPAGYGAPLYQFVDRQVRAQ
jgi:hypothetical protein